MTSTYPESGVGDTGVMKAAPTTARSGRFALPGLSLLAVVLVAACAVLLIVGHNQSTQRSDLVEAREAAVRAARQALINLDSISLTTIDADLARVIAGSTGQFKDLFSKSSADLKGIVVQRKSISTASVRSAGVVRADEDTATVLVAVDRTLKDNTTPQGVVQHDRWKVELERHGGRWLVAELDPVS